MELLLNAKLIKIATTSSLIFIVGLLGACGAAIPVSTVTNTQTPSLTQPPPSMTPSPIITPTHTVTPSPSSTPYSCELSDESIPWVILDYDTFNSFGATPNEMDEQLIQRNPQWQSFQQTVTTNPWTAGAVFDQGHGAPGEYGVNPAVLMVTVGMELDWQVPPDGDLYGRVVETGKTLYEYYLDYRHQEDVRDANPQIGNAATYALYRFFGEDTEKVEEWCKTFHVMFGDRAH